MYQEEQKLLLLLLEMVILNASEIKLLKNNDSGHVFFSLDQIFKSVSNLFLKSSMITHRNGVLKDRKVLLTLRKI